jgi:hypothetical protein
MFSYEVSRTMKKILLCIIFLCCGAAVVLFAAESWQKKPYTAWDDKDIQKIMNDSPWARKVDIVIGALRSQDDMPRSSSPVAGAGNIGGGGGAGGREGDMSVPGSTFHGNPMVRVMVCFISALPVKQAMMRAKYGDAVGSSPEANKVLSTPDNYYVVGLTGLRGLPPGDAQAMNKAIKEKSALQVKGKEPFGPVQVVMDSTTIALFFPREGHPIALEDGEVEVQVHVPNLPQTIRRKFALKEMVFNGKLEL